MNEIFGGFKSISYLCREIGRNRLGYEKDSDYSPVHDIRYGSMGSGGGTAEHEGDDRNEQSFL
jgi:hypothetical protein